MLAAISVILTLYIPILTGQAVDCILGSGAVDFDGIWDILKKMAVIIVLTAVVQWVMNTCNNKIAYQVVRDVRDEAFKKLQILPLKYIDGHSHGDIVSRVIADVDQFSDGLLMGFTQLFTGVVTILGTLVFMFCARPMSCWILQTIMIFWQNMELCRKSVLTMPLWKRNPVFRLCAILVSGRTWVHGIH